MRAEIKRPLLIYARKLGFPGHVFGKIFLGAKGILGGTPLADASARRPARSVAERENIQAQLAIEQSMQYITIYPLPWRKSKI